MLYIISNLCNPERLNNCLKDVLKFFPFENICIVYGVDKETIKVEDGIIKTDGHHFGEITEWKGNITETYHLGCVMSHINVLHDAIQKGYNEVIICEDDLLLNANLDRYLEAYMNNRPKDRELLRLSWHPNLNHMHHERVNSFRSEGKVWGCEMYMLNKNGLNKLYKLFQEDFVPTVDGMLEKANNVLNTYITNRSFGIQWNNGFIDKSDREGSGSYNKKQCGYGFTISQKRNALSFK